METSLIVKRLKALQKFAELKELAGIYISSFDHFLSEYVPLGDNHRYHITGFSGSVAEVLVPAIGRAILFVDGRYHEQADKEVDATLIEVVKVPYGVELQKALIEKIHELGIKTLGLEGDRTPLGLEKELDKHTSVLPFDLGEIAELINAPGFTPKGEVEQLSEALSGESVRSKLKRVVSKGECFFLSSLDSISWVTNMRGYHHPFQSTFIAKSLVLFDRVILFVPPEVEFAKGVEKCEDFTVFKLGWDKFEDKLTDLIPKVKAERVFFDPLSTTGSDFRILFKVFGADLLREKVGGIVSFHATKNPVEIEEMEKACGRSAKVIKRIIDWTRSEAVSRELDELEYFQKANEFYKEEGARGLSFKTIAGVGANSSIIHFSSPSPKVKINQGDLLLLDSGAFYESGLATDCTRAFIGKGAASEKQKKLYTLTLKGLLNAMNAVFPEGTPGCYLDSLARAPLRAHGFDFAHGTGHGIGINVHEGGYRLTPVSQQVLIEGRVGSIEPGVYIPGEGGVRLENVVVVEKHPEFEGMYKVRPLIYLGFMKDLIEDSLLNEDEKRWLSDYESECEKRSLSFNA